MYAPELIEIPQTRDIIQEFRGYNNNVRIADNEFHAMKNLTSDNYPVLSPRGKRGVVKTNFDCKGILSKDSIAYVTEGSYTSDNLYISGDYLYYGDRAVLKLDPTIKGERRLISMGAYIIVFPDMKFFNTVDANDCGDAFDLNERKYSESYTFTTLVNGEGAYAGTYQNITDDDLLFEAGYGCFWGRAQTVYIDPLVSNEFTWIPADKSETKDDVTVNYSFYVSELNSDLGNYFSFESSYGMLHVKCIDQENFKETVIRLLDESTILLANVHVTRSVNVIENYQDKEYSSHTRTYPIYIDPYIDTDGQLHFLTSSPSLIGNGSKRLVRKNSISVIEKCIHVAPEGAGYDRWKKTWNDPSNWEEIPTIIGIRVPSMSAWGERTIGYEAQCIINSKSGDVLIISSSSPLLKTMCARYSGEKAERVRDSVVDEDGEDRIYVKGCLDFVATGTAAATISFRSPKRKMDFLFECENRLWGCRYGENSKGEFVNEIYATELGSFKNWEVFNKTDDDSYVLPLGSDGKFTGAINFNGTPIFFKENCAHIIYGSYPTSYSLVTETGMGLQAGSHKSLAIASNTLYYKSEDGIYAYNGASYAKISDALGKEHHTEAIGCATADKYYVSMIGSSDEKRKLYVFDNNLNVWHVEDDIDISHMVRHKNDVYLYDKSNMTLYTVKATPQNAEDGEIEWYCESGIIGFSTPDSKYISKIQLRLSLPLGSNVSFFVQYDSDEYWEFLGSLSGTSLRAFSIPIMPRKCDHFRIRIEGSGDCKIFSISKVMEEGGEYR